MCFLHVQIFFGLKICLCYINSDSIPTLASDWPHLHFYTVILSHKTKMECRFVAFVLIFATFVEWQNHQPNLF